MTHKQINQMIQSIGLPYAYRQFPENTGQQPPFVCFFYSSPNDVYADNQNYQRIETLIIELYTDSKDFGNETVIENILAENGLTYTKNETALNSERMLEVIYTMEVMINAEE